MESLQGMVFHSGGGQYQIDWCGDSWFKVNITETSGQHVVTIPRQLDDDCEDCLVILSAFAEKYRVDVNELESVIQERDLSVSRCSPEEIAIFCKDLRREKHGVKKDALYITGG